MPKIKEVEVYEFDELSPEAKERAIEKLRDLNTEDIDWAESEIGYWKEQLESMGFTEPEVRYSGFSSQGDGASFTSKGFDFEEFFSFKSEPSETSKSFDFTECNDLYPEIAKAIGGEENELHRNILSIESIDSHYSHESTTKVSDYYLSDWFSTMDRYPEDRDPSINYEKLASEFYDENGFLDYLEKVRLTLSKYIYSELEESYDYLIEDEAVTETIKANNYEFNEDGTLA